MYCKKKANSQVSFIVFCMIRAEVWDEYLMVQLRLGKAKREELKTKTKGMEGSEQNLLQHPLMECCSWQPVCCLYMLCADKWLICCLELCHRFGQDGGAGRMFLGIRVCLRNSQSPLPLKVTATGFRGHCSLLFKEVVKLIHYSVASKFSGKNVDTY